MQKTARKLTPDQAREVRRVYAANEAGYQRLSKRYGVSPTTITRIVHNRTYKDAA